MADRQQSTLDTILTLFDSAREQIAENDDFIGLDSLIRTVQDAGVFFLRGAGALGSVGDYRLELELRPTSSPQVLRFLPDTTVATSPDELQLFLNNNKLDPQTVTIDAFQLLRTTSSGITLADETSKIGGVSYDADNDLITVSLNGVLPDGNYRLLVDDTITNGIGIALDGNRDSLPGGRFVGLFAVDSTAPTQDASNPFQLSGVNGSDGSGIFYAFSGSIRDPLSLDGQPIVVQIDVDGDGFDDGSTIVMPINGRASYVVNATTAIPANQQNTVEARFTDSRGNQSSPVSQTVNTGIPVVTAVSVANGDILVEFNRSDLTNASQVLAYSVSGRSISGATFDSVTQTATLDVSGGIGDGQFQLTVRSGGSNGIQTTGGVDLDGDVDGVAGGDHVRQLIVDTQAPVIVDVGLNPDSDTGVPNDNITILTDLFVDIVIRDAFPAGNNQVTVSLGLDGDGLFDDGTLTVGLPNSNQQFTATLMPNRPLGDGVTTIGVQVVDGVGNTTATSFDVTIDRVSPETRVVANVLLDNTDVPNGIRFVITSDENLDPTAAVNLDNYTLLKASGDRDFFNFNEVNRTSSISSITYQDANAGVPAQIVVTVSLASDGTDNDDYLLVINGEQITDIAGNLFQAGIQTSQFQFSTAGPRILDAFIDNGFEDESADRTIIEFEDVDLIRVSATNAANFRLEQLNASGNVTQVLTLDTPVYDSFADRVILSGFGLLAAGEYRLTVFAAPDASSPGSTGARNVSLVALDGDGDGAPGGNFVTNLTVSPPDGPDDLTDIVLDGNAENLAVNATQTLRQAATTQKRLTEADFAAILITEVRLVFATTEGTAAELADAVNQQIQDVFRDRFDSLGFDPNEFLVFWSRNTRFLVNDPADDPSLSEEQRLRIGFDLDGRRIEDLIEGGVLVEFAGRSNSAQFPEFALAIVPVNTRDQLITDDAAIAVDGVIRLDGESVAADLTFLVELEALTANSLAGSVFFPVDGDAGTSAFTEFPADGRVKAELDTSTNLTGIDPTIQIIDDEVIAQFEAIFGAIEQLDRNFLILWFDPVDFLLQDALGNRVGHRNNQTLNEVAGTFYSGDGFTELVVIPDALSDIYTLALSGVTNRFGITDQFGDTGRFGGTATFIKGGELRRRPLAGLLRRSLDNFVVVAQLDFGFRSPGASNPGSGTQPPIGRSDPGDSSPPDRDVPFVIPTLRARSAIGASAVGRAATIGLLNSILASLADGDSSDIPVDGTVASISSGGTNSSDSSSDSDVTNANSSADALTAAAEAAANALQAALGQMSPAVRQAVLTAGQNLFPGVTSVVELVNALRNLIAGNSGPGTNDGSGDGSAKVEPEDADQGSQTETAKRNEDESQENNTEEKSDEVVKVSTQSIDGTTSPDGSEESRTPRQESDEVTLSDVDQVFASQNLLGTVLFGTLLTRSHFGTRANPKQPPIPTTLS